MPAQASSAALLSVAHLCWVLVWGWGWELRGISLTRTLPHSRGLHPYEFLTSRRPLTDPSTLGARVQHMDFGNTDMLSRAVTLTFLQRRDVGSSVLLWLVFSR